MRQGQQVEVSHGQPGIGCPCQTPVLPGPRAFCLSGLLLQDGLLAQWLVYTVPFLALSAIGARLLGWRTPPAAVMASGTLLRV